MSLKRERPRSLRHRLARSIALTSTISVVVLALLLDKSFDHRLQQRFDAGLHARARAVAAYLGASVRDAEPLETWMPEFREAGHTDFYQAWDASGQTLARSASSHQADLPLPTAQDAEAQWFDLQLPDGHHGRAIALVFDLPDGDSRDSLRVVVAEEREQLDALMVQLHGLLFAGALTTLVVVLMLSHWLLRRGLAPLDGFAATLAATRPEQAAKPLFSDELPAELMPVARKFDQLVMRVFKLLDRERRFARDLAQSFQREVARRDALTTTQERTDQVTTDAAGGARYQHRHQMAPYATSPYANVETIPGAYQAGVSSELARNAGSRGSRTDGPAIVFSSTIDRY